MRVPSILTGCLCLTLLAGCAWMPNAPATAFQYKQLPVATSSAVLGEGHTVTFKGAALELQGQGIQAGDTLRHVQLTGRDLKPVDLASQRGKVRLISIVPSLDTKVCEQQTHYLSEKNNGLERQIELITVSVDTPFAQDRFAKEAKIQNVAFLSDYRGAEFGKAHGLLVKDIHLLARTVMVVDRQNVVRYLQVTPELGQFPDMEAAFRVARRLANDGTG